MPFLKTRPAMYEPLRFLHILFALSLFAGLGASMALRPLVGRLAASGHLEQVIAALERNVRIVTLPSGILTVVFGFAAAEAGRWNTFTEGWLLISLLAAVALIAANLFIVYPHLRSLRQALAEEPHPGPELLARVRRPLIRHIGQAQMLTLLVIAYLMVYKPF